MSSPPTKWPAKVLTLRLATSASIDELPEVLGYPFLVMKCFEESSKRIRFIMCRGMKESRRCLLMEERCLWDMEISNSQAQNILF